ncbi:MAG: hypothetical protein UT96_C0046G0006, partial [Candidatus Woesebacteria bacterium GW2011_GWC2_40_30]
LLSVPAIRYLFVYGFFGVSDDLHVAWLYEMDRVIKLLQFPPRFVPDLSFGFGYPLFNFVYPLPFYIGEVIHLLGFSLVDSIKIVFGLSIPLSMYFMYKFLKEFLSEELSLAGSVLYVYAPYRAVEIFVRGTIGEIVAFTIIPIVALAFVNLSKEKPSVKWVGAAALSVAALVLSHNIMAYMFMPFALLLLISRIIFIIKNKKAAIIRSLIGVFLGLAASIYFWLPAIYESRLMHYDTVFNFYDHFPALKQFIIPYFGYGASVPGPYDTMSFYFGLTGILTAIFGLILFALKFKKFSFEEKMFFIWGEVILLVSIFMMNFRSAFLWRNLPLLPYFQFPWRFLAMVVFSIPILLLGFSKYKFGKIASYIIIALTIALNFNYFKISEYLGRGDAYYLNRYIPVPVASEEYKKTSEEYLRLPKDTEARPQSNFPRAYADVSGIYRIEEINTLDAAVSTDYKEDFILNYSKYYFPGWFAKIDGKSVGIASGKPYGQIVLQVPAGQHTVEVYYRESLMRQVLDIVSLIGVGAAVFLILKKKKI